MSRNVIIGATIVIIVISAFMYWFANLGIAIGTFIVLGSAATIIHVGMKQQEKK